MPPSGYLIDANLLVLLVVGKVGRELIGRHRRLQDYTAEDYDLLVDTIESVGQLIVTPNTLTESSNLLGQHGEPDRSRLLEMLRILIVDAREVVISSEIASANLEFVRLGLTDAVLLEAATEESPLLTTDLRLYLAALSSDASDITAVNFRHLRSS